MDDFERTAWGDAYYAAIGRVLTFATRFEAHCRTLNTILGFKKNRGILDSINGIHAFVKRLHKVKLAKHISSIAANDKELKDILDKARSGRNEIAHELTLGLDRCIDRYSETYIKKLVKRLQQVIRSLALADRIVSLTLSIETNECVPNEGFLAEYPELVEKWATEMEEIE